MNGEACCWRHNAEHHGFDAHHPGGTSREAPTRLTRLMTAGEIRKTTRGYRMTSLRRRGESEGGVRLVAEELLDHRRDVRQFDRPEVHLEEAQLPIAVLSICASGPLWMARRRADGSSP